MPVIIRRTIMSHETVLKAFRVSCGFLLKQVIVLSLLGGLIGLPLAVALAADKAVTTEESASGPKKNLTVDLGKGVNLEFVLILPGTFMMGAENISDNEKPVHKVTLTKPFYMTKYEVTQEQWQAVTGENPSQFKETADAPKRPVEQVSWDDISKKFLPKLAERMPKGLKARLPTEAEWEYSCRAGTAGDYAGELDAMGWYEINSKETTHPVGGKKPNAWGLYDMHGNVWEWCADIHGDYSAEAVTDPKGAASGSSRIGRGGCWSIGNNHCKSAFRDWGTPGYKSPRLGLRLAVDVP
ncbi:MAG: formylglycine-generating enzyme family protein [Victivallales bacterium]